MSQSIESNNGTAPTTQHISLSDNIPNQLKSNMHYFNLNNQLKYDLEQQQVIKLQQMEAIKLIQVSLEKLTATTTVPLHNQTTRKQNGSTPAPSILVYKETSLHKNLLVSKILNKAKFFYYQSIVQTMRLSLMSKLNYYSTLIQQLYPSQTVTSNDTTSKEDKPMSPVENESSLIEEMKLLMQQILYDTYQFNSLNSCNVNSSSIDTNPNALIEFTSFNSTNLTTINNYNDTVNSNANNTVLKECSASDLNKTVDSLKLVEVKCSEDEKHQPINDNSNEERIKQLNNVKNSLYSLLFPVKADTTDGLIKSNAVESDIKKQQSKTTQLISQNENFNKSKRKCSVGEVVETGITKRQRNYCSIDSLDHVILCDDTNVLCRRKAKLNMSNNNKKQRRVPSKQHITSKLLKLSLKTATKPVVLEPLKVSQPESFINLEVLV